MAIDLGPVDLAAASHYDFAFPLKLTGTERLAIAPTAEANSIVRVYADLNLNGSVDAFDPLLGQTVATPLDGTNAQFSGFSPERSV